MDMLWEIVMICKIKIKYFCLNRKRANCYEKSKFKEISLKMNCKNKGKFINKTYSNTKKRLQNYNNK